MFCFKKLITAQGTEACFDRPVSFELVCDSTQNFQQSISIVSIKTRSVVLKVSGGVGRS